MKRRENQRRDRNEVAYTRFKIPLSLAERVLQNNLFAPFRLFIYLKVISTNGQILASRELYQRASKDLQISEKSVRRHFQMLRDKNWIGQFKSGSFILRSFDKLREMEKLPGKTAVWFDYKTHLPAFKAYIIGACLGKLAIKQRTNEWKERRLPEKRRSISNVRNLPLPTHYPIACAALAQIYGISVGTAFNWKQEAKQAGFIDIIHTLRPLPIDNKLEWQRTNPELAHRIIIRDNKYFIQYPDKVCSLLKFTRRKVLHAK